MYVFQLSNANKLVNKVVFSEVFTDNGNYISQCEDSAGISLKSLTVW